MKLVFKIIIAALLIIPASVATCTIWVFGGWTRGFDYMPNPLYWLFNWVDN